MSDSNIKNNTYYMLASLLVTVAALTYASLDSLVEMERMWSTKEEYGYAYMIPFITAYFIWQRFGEMSKIETEISWVGGIALLASFFIILLGIMSATHSITQYGYIIALISSMYAFLGRNMSRVILAPMLLLLLIVPLPGFVFNNLSNYLQLISSEIGVWVIRLFDISVYLEGNVIDLGIYKLQVVEACSGLRYLFPLFSLSIIAAFIYKAEMWKKIVIVLSSFPITVIMNSFRIGMIGVLVEYGGVEQAEGFLHDFEGWIVFMASAALLVLEMWVLLKVGRIKTTLSDAFSIEYPENTKHEFKKVHYDYKYIVLTMAIVAVCIVIGQINERDEIIPDRTSYASFPLSFSEWEGRRDRLDGPVLKALKLDDYFLADYKKDNEHAINLYMAYYASQRSGQAAHSPRSCIPGAGWKMQGFRQKNIGHVIQGEENMEVNRLVIKKGDYRQLVYYWFEQRGRNITNEYVVKWYLFWDALTKNRTDGALVRLTTPVLPEEDIQDAEARLEEFLAHVYPVTSEYIPD